MAHWFRDPAYGFRMAAGDDRTDEDVFEAAPESAWTVKIGDGPTRARYALKNTGEMRALLEQLAAACAEKDAGDDVPPSAGRRDALRAPAMVMPRTRALAAA